MASNITTCPGCGHRRQVKYGKSAWCRQCRAMMPELPARPAAKPTVPFKRGTSMHHVGGGDRQVSTERVVYAEPKPKQTGLDWSKHTAPEPVRPPEPIVAAVQQPRPKTRSEPKARDCRDCGIRIFGRQQLCDTCKAQREAPRPRVPRSPREPAERPLCACGKPRSPSATRCRECHFADPNRATRTSVVNLGVAISEYLAGSTIPEIAERHDWPIASIRKGLKRRRIPMRDDRAGHSGGRPLERDLQQVHDVRRLYESGLSKTQVADKLGLTPKIVANIMARYGIQARQGQSGSGDTLGDYRRRLAELGVTATFIRSWAMTQGIDVHPRAMPPRDVVEAYAAQQERNTA